jgi:hypothetical protein
VDTQEGLESSSTLRTSAPSLALDSNDYPHILYGYSTGNGNTTVKYAMWNGSGWSFQTVIPNADVSFGNIALDSRGYPHFTYYTDGLLMYASWNGNAWNTQVVDSITGTNRYPGFLNLDSNNNPHISYIKDALMYAEWTGTTWDIQTVDAVDAGYIVPGFRSMVLDSSGNPCISYMSYYGKVNQLHNGTVMYAKLESPLISDLQVIIAVVVVVAVVLTGLILYFKKRRHQAESH